MMHFIGIGASKSGTSWLFNNLSKIEGFHLPPLKEFHYFDRSNNYPSPNILSETLLVRRLYKRKYFSNASKKIMFHFREGNFDVARFYFRYYFSNCSDRWYLSLFKGFRGSFTGEITPSYSILELNDIKRMYSLNPELKLVLMLRNPIDRMWSNYRFYSMKQGVNDLNHIKNEDIIEYMEQDGPTLRTDYIRTINNYKKVFNSNQLLICFFDAIIDAPKELIENIVYHIADDSSIVVRHARIKKIINKSPTYNCPDEVHDYLKSRYYNQIKKLSELYGGYFSKWYENTYGEKSMNSNRDLLPSFYTY